MATGGLQITISSNEYSKLNPETALLCSVKTTGERETQLWNVPLSAASLFPLINVSRVLHSMDFIWLQMKTGLIPPMINESAEQVACEGDLELGK